MDYTRQAKEVLKIAEKSAKEMAHPYVGTEHLLLGLRKVYTGVAAQVLGANGVDEENIQKVMSELISPSGEMTGRKRPEFSPRLEYILEDSKVEAEQFHSEEIGTEHMLIALIRDIDCVATKILIFRRYIRKYLRLLALTRRLIRKNTDRKEEERTGYWISMVRI